MKHTQLETLWIIINANDMVKNGMDRQNAEEVAIECVYDIINENTCIIISDQTAYLVRRDGFSVIESIEVNPELLL